MTRFFIVLMLLFTMYWTWGWVHNSLDRDKELFIHSEIKSNVQKMLGEAILAQRPQAREIEFTSFWTKSLSPKEIHLFFTYRFIDNLISSKVATAKAATDTHTDSNTPKTTTTTTQATREEADKGHTEALAMKEEEDPNQNHSLNLEKKPIYQEVSGKAFLYLKSQSSQKQNWLLEKIVTTQDKLTFTTEIEIESRF